MKYAFVVAFAISVISCNSAQNSAQNSTQNTTTKTMSRTDYASTITAADLSKHLYTFASDKMEGRMTGSSGQKMAAEYLKDFYIAQGIEAPIKKGEYYQNIPASYFKRMKNGTDSENVVAFIPGSEKPEEVIVLSAHYDHVGMENGEVFNGADDDGSGTVAMLEMAEAFQKAVKNGDGPKRSLLFLHVTGEEIGLYGSKYYTENPLFPLENTVCNLNTDMVGRVGNGKEGKPDYVYLIGSDKLSNELHNVSAEVAKTYSDLEIDYTYNDENDPNRFYYRSDHYNFAKNNIPIIFYFNGVHADYHKATDTPDKIDYDLLEKRAKLIFHTAWEVANRAERITADKLN